jgi:hypothetical protein
MSEEFKTRFPDARPPKLWRVGGDLEDGREITFHDSRGIKMCTFVGYFDGKNAFRLRFHSREYGGVVPKTRVVYLAELEKKK